MRKYFIIQKILEYVSRRKINFFLTLLLTIITIYMMSTVMLVYGRAVYSIIEIKKAFSNQNILNIQVVMDGQEALDYDENAGQFLRTVEEMYGEDFDKFMYFDVNYIVNGEKERLPTLYIGDSSYDLCKVDFYMDTEMEALLEEDKEFIPGFVSESNLENYPLGTILQNANIDTKTIIAGYFEDDSRWVGNSLFFSSDVTADLNECIVSGMDNAYFEYSDMFYGNLYTTTYVTMDEGRDIQTYKDEIREVAQDLQIKCYIYSLDEMIAEEKENNQVYMKAVGTLVGFAVLVALAGMLASYLADVGSWQKEIAIMYLNGVAPGDIYIIILLENLIKAVLGLGIAFYLYGHDLVTDEHRIYWDMIVPILAVATFVCVVFFSYIAFKTVNQRKLLSIYGGSKL